MTSTPAFRSFRRGPRIPLEFLVDHDPNVIPIPASLSDLLPQLLLNFTSWETSTRTTATNKAPIVDAINALRQSIEPCKMYKDSSVLPFLSGASPNCNPKLWNATSCLAPSLSYPYYPL